jgi:hypothetical protein
LLPYTYPIDWLSSRPSNPAVLLRRFGADGLLAELVRLMEPGDELRKFESPRQDWERMRGRYGYALVRDGKPIRMVVLRLN